MEIETLKQRIQIEIDHHAEELSQLSLAIHAQPELAGEEHFASQLLAGRLERSGFSVKSGVAGLPTAFTARLDGRQPGSQVGIMAEYDALPEIGHACGHNLIAAAALGAGLGLRAVMAELPGTVWIFGTPGEEKGIGKVAMLKDGLFKELDSALVAHPRNQAGLGRVFTAVKFVEYTFTGKPSHAGSAPEQGINALDACIATFNGVNALKKHLRDDVRTNGIILEGGTAANIVPERARCVFGLRANDLPYLEHVVEKVDACAQAGAMMAGAGLETRVTMELADMLFNQALSHAYGRNAAALGHQALGFDPSGGGSTDMGSVSRVAPAIHPFFKIGPSDLVLHTSEFAAAARTEQALAAMVEAAKLLALTAVDILVDENLVKQARAEFNRAVQQ